MRCPPFLVFISRTRIRYSSIGGCVALLLDLLSVGDDARAENSGYAQAEVCCIVFSVKITSMEWG